MYYANSPPDAGVAILYISLMEYMSLSKTYHDTNPYTYNKTKLDT